MAERASRIRKSNLKSIPAVDGGYRRFTELLSRNVLGSDHLSVRVVQVLPITGSEPRHPHTHRTMDEAIFVLEGAGIAWVDGEVCTLEAGDLLFVPRGVPHVTVSSSDRQLRLFCAFSAGDPGERVVHTDIKLRPVDFEPMERPGATERT
ncbi:MAG: cupin domain-containing protein [Armatimonadetes bacterium]|nr:cupin domain-containing protein [Armatimonadota bacterium]